MDKPEIRRVDPPVEARTLEGAIEAMLEREHVHLDFKGVDILEQSAGPDGATLVCFRSCWDASDWHPTFYDGMVLVRRSAPFESALGGGGFAVIGWWFEL
jgi:hypothetical protein